jgi:hypothetical protein
MNEMIDGTPPFLPPPSTEIEPSLAIPIRCIQCQRDIFGLPRNGMCPQCGTPVNDSVHSTMLLYSSPEYTEKLHKGVFLIQATIVASIIMVVVAVVINLLSSTNIAGASAVGAVTQIPSFALGIVLLYGWWRLSEPDPEYIGNDTRERVSGFVRISVIIRVVIAVAALPFALLAPPFFMSASSGSFTLTTTDYIWIAAGLVNIVVMIGWFIATTLYIKWLGVRLANARLVNRAKNFLWLGPLLMTVGMLVIIGPLIALVLYWRMLDWIRKDLKNIRADQAHVAAQV